VLAVVFCASAGVCFGAPVIVVEPNELSFVAVEGGSNPASQILYISNGGMGKLEWGITEDCDWLSATPQKGNCVDETDEIEVRVNTGGLSVGEYSYNLTIVAPDASNSPQAVPVNLLVRESGEGLWVPYEYPTIQSAIDDANDGDIVIVADGLYTGDGNRDIYLNGKGITVRSENGPENCIIDCQGSEEEPHRGFKIIGQEEDGLIGLTVINGFTIVNGWADDDYKTTWYCYTSNGGGIFCIRSNLVIRNCIITNNTATAGVPPYLSSYWGRGGGISVIGGSVLIENCVCSDNLADGVGWDDTEYTYYDPGEGGGIYAEECSLDIRNCVITDNVANSAFYIDYGKPGMGGGVFCDNSDTKISNSTFSGNFADLGGGVYCRYDNPTIINCILWNDEPFEIEGNPIVIYSDVEGGWEGEGNVDVNPLLADNMGHLSWNSPCVDAGDPNFVTEEGEVDIDGELRVMGGRIDMGADEIPYDKPYLGISTYELIFFVPKVEVNPERQILTIWKGPGVYSWTIEEDCEWLSISPNTGYIEMTDAYVSVNVEGLSCGEYGCEISIISTNADNSPMVVNIKLHVFSEYFVPHEYSKIQSAIDNANNFDVIIVADGVYTGDGNRDIDFKGKALTEDSYLTVEKVKNQFSTALRLLTAIMKKAVQYVVIKAIRRLQTALL
jgi:hypothetical protein